jgi:hypothetical protein
MRKLKLLLALLALFMGSNSLWAQKDVTSQYITNATLSSLDGWTVTNFNAPKQGNNTVGYASECWAGNNNGSPVTTNYSLLQTITLPSGHYRLVSYSFYRFSWGAGDNPSKSLAYLKAGDNTPVAIKTLGSITATGYANSQAEGANCFDAKMYRNTIEFTIAADNTPIEIGIYGTHDAAASWVIAGMFELFDLDDLASVSSPTDVTYAITNSGFEYRDLTGWTQGITKGNKTYANNNNFASKAGIGFFESWNNKVALGDAGAFTQTLNNMSAGLYELSVYAQNIEQRNSDSSGKGMYVTANSDKTEIGARGQYKVRTTLKNDGDLTIGIKLEGCTGDWVCFDRFELLFYGDPLAAYQELLDAAVEEAQALIDGAAGSAISTTAKTAWQAVIDANDNDDKAFSEESDFTTALDNISNANANYQAMAAPYAKWLKVKAGANAMTLVANDNASATTTLTDAISAQNTAAEAALTLAALNTAIGTLRTAVKTFINAAEPTGGASFEITCLVENPSFDNNTIDGWTRTVTKSGGAAQTNYTCNEFWNNTFDFYQDLVDLPNGSYQLSVQAFSRPGGNNVAYPAYVGGTNSVTAELYVNDDASTVGNIYAYTGNTTAAKVSSGSFPDYKCVVDGGTDYWVPNGMEGANLYFADENVYKTTVAALVEDGNLRIGFRDETYTADQWTIFDNFRLYYYGSDKLVYYKQYLPQLKAEVSADLSNGAYANVLVSSEDEALDAALAATPASETESAYETVINDLKDAQAAFRAAVTSYDAIVAAKAYGALTKVSANIGEDIFQYNATTNNTRFAEYEEAKEDVDDYEFTTSSTAAGAQALVDALDDAIDAYNDQPLNAPDADKRYFVSIVEAEKDWNGNAVTFIAGGRADEGNYAIKYLAPANANLNQALKFTVVAGNNVAGNNYKISVLTPTGTEHYLTTNSLAYGSNKSQIRTTSDASKALEVKIKGTATSGQFQLYNTVANALIANDNNNDMYTANSANFTIAEASQSSVGITIADNVKLATRIFPFTPVLPSGVKAYSCEASAGDVLTLVEVAEPAANTPYLLYAENGYTGDALTGWGLAGAVEYTVGWLTGVYAQKDAPVDSYVLQNGASGVGFYKVAESKQPKVGANRCYLTASADARFFSFDFGEVTGVDALKALATGKAVIYNAAGAVLPSLQKGLNIIKMSDGSIRKVMVK